MSADKLLIVTCAALALTACGTTKADRTLSGALTGAGAGLVVAGPVGAAVGGVAGATTGYTTDRNDIYLGRPAWKK